MKDSSAQRQARLGVLLLGLAATGAAQQNSPQQAGTLAIAGHEEQTPLVRIGGKSYVDIESLARISHGTLRFEGSRTILTLPGAGAGGAAAAVPSVKTPELSSGYLSAEIEALAQLREWRAALVSAVQNNAPVTDGWVSRLRRSAEAKQQLAVAAVTSAPDRQALGLLQNEFTAMQQMSDGLVAIHAKASYIAPDSFDNNAQDQKILSCQQELVAMASTRKFEDAPACH